jgi:hypothetical protein
MILRVSPAWDTGKPRPGWSGFADSQKLPAGVSGYVSQPAHGALAGRLAASLVPEVFGSLPAEVVEAVAQHDLGWSIADLDALESVASRAPVSFLDVAPEQATQAWRRSIRAAEERSPLQAVLTIRHFCLLAPGDGDPTHDKFKRDENGRRKAIESTCGAAPADLDRYTAVLGFCDLLSLLMCSGLVGSFEVPLAHPADPEARHAPQVVCKLEGGTVSFDRPVPHPGTRLYANAWVRSTPGGLADHRCEWRSE